ncbi:MAG: BMP family ABC transporter substrate-binding protein [Micrococcaceae bacterium]
MVKRALGTTVVGASVFSLAACGSAPDQQSSSSGTSGNYLACMVSDSGGFNDKSFNQSGHDGLLKAQSDLGIQTKAAQSNSDSDFKPNLNQMMQANCNLTVTVGFLLADATKETAQANTSKHFAIIDDDSIDLANVKPIIYDTAQAAFLAGYVAAAESKTGKVGTYGGTKIPTVTIFMDGFTEGVKYYNEKKSKNVQVIGWNKDSQDGVFSGDFQDVSKGKQVTQNLVDQGADIVMPVAGPVGAGSATLAKELGKNQDGSNKLNLIWVDADGYVTQPEYKDYFITSVVKEMSGAVEDVIKQDKDGKFDKTPYVGTLKNDGVDIAPYHDFDSKISQDTKNEVTQLKQDIINGTVKVESTSSPKGS